MSNPQFRAERLFNVDCAGMEIDAFQFGMSDLLVRVEVHSQLSPAERNSHGSSGATLKEIRYGVMLSFDSSGVGKDNVMIEIPVAPGLLKCDREERQREIITEYITAMREAWQTFLRNAPANRVQIDCGTFVDMTRDSVEGRAGLLRAFQASDDYKSFFNWFFPTALGFEEGQVAEDNAELKAEVLRHQMQFIAGRTYTASLDWAFPYCCYREPWQVACFDGGESSSFYPFFNFGDMSIVTKLSTKFTPQLNTDDRHFRQKLKPSHYTLFLFYTQLIEKIAKLEQESLKLVEPYYLYVGALGALNKKLIENGPLSQLTAENKHKLALMWYSRDDKSDWTGEVDDREGWWGDNTERHAQQLLRGSADIVKLQNAFSGIIHGEEIFGRNKTRKMDSVVVLYALLNNFVSDTSAICKEELWQFNTDDYGTNLMLARLVDVLGSSPETRNSFYQKVLKPQVFEAEFRADDSSEIEDQRKKMLFVGGPSSGAASLLMKTLAEFYPLRAGELEIAHQKVFVQTHGISSSGPSLSGVAGSVDGLYNGGSAGRVVIPDPHFTRISSQLLGVNPGGAALAGDLYKAQVKVAEEIKRIFGERSSDTVGMNRSHITAEKLQKISDFTEDVKNDLYNKIPQDKIAASYKNQRQVGGSAALALISAALTAVAYANLPEDADADNYDMDMLRFASTSLSMGSDVVGAVGTYYGIAARAEAINATSSIKMAAKGVKFMGAFAGGVGALWFLWDGYQDVQNGNEKDAALNVVSGIAAGVGAAIGGGILLAGSVAAAPVVIVLLGVVIAAQLLKSFRVFSSEMEDFARSLLTDPLDKNGMDQFKHFLNEYEEGLLPTVRADHEKDRSELLERVIRFIDDPDTYDDFGNVITKERKKAEAEKNKEVEACEAKREDSQKRRKEEREKEREDSKKRLGL